MKTEPKTRLEWEVCGRCGGGGSYSYNQMDGSRCYGCNGAGYNFTKRGAIARKYFDDLLSIRIADVKVGDLVQFGFQKKFFAKITEVETRTDGLSGKISIWYMSKQGRTGLTASPDHKVRKGWSVEENTAALEKALAYQNTLTAKGTVKKN